MAYNGTARRRGCLELIGAGCLTMVVLAVVAGIVLYYKAGDWARSGSVFAVKIVADSVFEDLDIPEKEREAAMVHINDFSKKIESGEVSANQVAAVLDEFVRGPAFAALLARGFQRKYLDVSTLPEEEKATGRKTLSRFSQGVSMGEIPTDKIGEVKKIIVVAKSGEGRSEEYKDSLSDKELRRALKIMKDAADEAQVADRLFRINIASEIREAIVTGMEAGAKKEREF